MNKKAWSVILLCLVIGVFVLTVGLFVDYLRTEYSIAQAGLEAGGAFDALAFVVSILSVGFAFSFFGFLLGSVGWLSSIAGIKIARNRALRCVFIGFACFFGALLLFVAGTVLYTVF